MAQPPVTDERLAEIVAVWRETCCNISETKRRLGYAQGISVRRHIRTAIERGMIEPMDYQGETVKPMAAEIQTIRAKRIAEFEAKKRKGDWRKPVFRDMGPEPFSVTVLGDPHLDNPGTNLEEWERYWFALNPAERRFAVCVGDYFDNWVRALGHLYAEASTTPSEAFALFEHYLTARPGALIGSCAGNHDEWRDEPSLLSYVMRRYGVPHRNGAIRLAWGCGERTLTCAIRHKWRGQSQYSAAHGIVRGAEWNDDHLLIGGHIHQDEDRRVIHAATGRIQLCVQVSAFKELDHYADVHGFRPRRIAPARVLVIDPRVPETDPDMIAAFVCPERAADHLDNLRCE
jgi:hypothetical protein